MGLLPTSGEASQPWLGHGMLRRTGACGPLRWPSQLTPLKEIKNVTVDIIYTGNETEHTTLNDLLDLSTLSIENGCVKPENRIFRVWVWPSDLGWWLN